jgi:hypothetical protein
MERFDVDVDFECVCVPPLPQAATSAAKARKTGTTVLVCFIASRIVR